MGLDQTCSESDERVSQDVWDLFDGQRCWMKERGAIVHSHHSAKSSSANESPQRVLFVHSEADVSCGEGCFALADGQ